MNVIIRNMESPHLEIINKLKEDYLIKTNIRAVYHCILSYPEHEKELLKLRRENSTLRSALEGMLEQNKSIKDYWKKLNEELSKD